MKKSFEQQLPCPFTTISNFSHENPEFTKGGLKWLIFNKREELITKNVIRYWGKKVLIHRPNFYNFILNGGTENIS
ncbi:hypothetical protein N9X66_07410 [Gammaproteobacteria bacterium]|nr:hypothetical protein [Gammaproteobacteria bacterium]